MFASQGSRKLDGVGLVSDLREYFVGSKIFFGELLGRAGSSDVFGFHEYLVANLEIGSRSSSAVSRMSLLDLSFGDSFSEVLV